MIMKKINSLTQLRAEKQRLQLLRLQQEDQLRQEWQTLKSLLRPARILRAAFERKQPAEDAPQQAAVSKYIYRKLASWFLQKLVNRRHKAG